MVVGIVGGGVADLRAVDHEVLVEEQAEFPFPIGVIADDDALQIDAFALVDAVVHLQLDAESAVTSRDVGDEGVLDIAELPRPRRILQPAELAFGPEAEAAILAADMVELSDVRIVDVADIAVLIEVEQHLAVSDYEVTGHESFSFRSGASCSYRSM